MLRKLSRIAIIQDLYMASVQCHELKLQITSFRSSCIVLKHPLNHSFIPDAQEVPWDWRPHRNKDPA